jgi:GMP synthase-like glutamine amidotransferase
VGNAWGLQFHVEVTAEMISAWFGGNADGERFVRELAEKQAVLDSVAQRIFRNFEGIVKGLKT